MIIKFSAVVALLNLDNKNIVSTGISRPIVTGAVLGVLFNNLHYGIFIGCIVELIMINLMPIGAFIPPNGTLITGITLILSNNFHIEKAGSLIPVVLIFGLFWGHMVKRISRLLWLRNSRLVELFLKGVENDKITFFRYNISVLIMDFFIFFLLTFAGSYVGIFIIQNVVRIFFTSYYLQFAFDKAVFFFPLFVLIYLLNSFDLPNKSYFILLGILLAGLVSPISLSPLLSIVLIGLFSYIVIFSINYYKEHYYEL